MNLQSLLVRMRQVAPWAIVVGGIAVAVAAYLQAINFPFVYDDNRYIVQNSKLSGLHLTELWRLLIEPYNSFSEFLPLRDFSYWLDMSLFGLNSSMFRMHNILLYLICMPLVYATTLRLWGYFRPMDAASAPWAAAIVTALFALNPAHAEAVVWISGRKDVLSGMFSLLALWLAVSAGRENGLSVPYAGTALVALFAAMLSKATAVAVAPVIAMVWFMYWRDMPVSKRRRSLLLWPFASLFLAMCIALFFSVSAQARMPFYFGIEAVTRTLAVLGWLARLAVTPEDRHFFYPVFEDPNIFAMVAIGAVVLVGAVAGAVMVIRKRSLEGFAAAAFLLLCIPTIQLIPYSPPSLASDRFVFLAVWPAILLVVSLVWRLKEMSRTVLLLIIAMVWCFQTVERPRDWRSLDSMVDNDLRAYPGYYMPTMLKMAVKFKEGLFSEVGEAAKSIVIPEFRDIAVKLADAVYEVRVVAVTTGNPQKAMSLLWELFPYLKQDPVQAQWNGPVNKFFYTGRRMYEEQWKYLVRKFPDEVSVHYNAGLWSLEIYNYDDAVVHFRAAIALQRLPESERGTAFKSLGVALLNSGHAAEAEAPLRAALEQSPPELSAYCTLSEVYKQTSRIQEAARAEADCRSRIPE